MLFPPRPLRWLFLDLNSYFASVEQHLNPHLRGKPIIVTPIDSETTCAIAASYEAKGYGIKTGTPVWEAKRLCPDLVIVSAQHGRYVEFHEIIVAEIWRHIPVTQICSIDEVACRLMDNENDVATASALAQRIKQGIASNIGKCLTASVGIAPNRLLAKLASDMMKPDGLVILHGGNLPEQLYPLQIGDISGIGHRMERRLASKGITTIRQLCEHGPRAAGRAWGGNNGDRLWFLLHGLDLPERPTQSRSIGHSHVLSPKMRGAGPAFLTARRLALKAASRLRRKEYETRLLMLHAKFEGDKGRWAMEMKIAPTQNSFDILSALEQLWQQLLASAHQQSGGLRLRMIGVTLGKIEPVNARQSSFFTLLGQQGDGIGATRGMALCLAMDKINARFGRNAVSLGPLSGGRMDAIGTKIAFGRIPAMSEFHE